MVTLVMYLYHIRVLFLSHHIIHNPVLFQGDLVVVKGRRMLLQKWLFLVTIWVLIVGHGSADSGELLGYGIPSPTACLNGPCQPLLSPPSSLPGYPSYGTPPPPPPSPSPSPFPGYPLYRGPPPPPPSPHISGYPSFRAPPPPTTPTGSGYPSYEAPPPPTTPTGSGYPSYGAPPPPSPKQPSTSSPGQGCFLPPFQSCFNSPPTPYEYLPKQNHSVPSSLPLSWLSVMVLSLAFAFLL